MSVDRSVRVAAVGIDPLAGDTLLAALPRDDRFEFVAWCDEGLDELSEEAPEAAAYPDYNVMLQDAGTELVLVGGPVEQRRDFAVRALTAGRHVVLDLPFCESALDADRVLRTALRSKLVATADLKWRDDKDLRALQAALAAEKSAGVHGVFRFEPVDRAATGGHGALAAVGCRLLDQVNVVARGDVGFVQTRVERRTEGRPDHGFLVYMPLRNGGWAVCRAGGDLGVGLPRWVVHAGGTTFTASDGRAVVTSEGQERAYDAPPEADDFWANLHEAVRHGAPLKCHPAEIVRAMKLHEAAIESAETGESVSI